jgi:quercetin dioxygenase-like cupin family protein
MTGLLASLCLALAAEPAPPQEIQTPGAVRWVDGPASLPKGCQYAVLEGELAKEGPLLVRIKLPDGCRILPHVHPKDERVTVLSGTLFLGTGDTFDAKAAKEMPAGSYGFTRAGVKHFGWVKGDTVLQLHGTGPWAVEYANPADDPRKK